MILCSADAAIHESLILRLAVFGVTKSEITHKEFESAIETYFITSGDMDKTKRSSTLPYHK